jgi:hypothetical protein
MAYGRRLKREFRARGNSSDMANNISLNRMLRRDAAPCRLPLR